MAASTAAEVSLLAIRLKKCDHGGPKQEIKLIEHNKTALDIFSEIHCIAGNENVKTEASCSVRTEKNENESRAI